MSLRGARRLPGDMQLRQRDEKLEALKSVVGKLAHDFNNFLAPQYGYITLLKDEIASGTTPAAYVGAMESSALKTEAYITSVLVGMRPYRQFSPREFQLDSVLQEMLEYWRGETPPGSEVELITNLEPSLYYGDEKQCRIIFEHLLSNVRYALAMGGQLEVTLRRQTLSGEEVQRLGLGTDQVFCVQVRDNGFGMNGEVVARAFEPFFTTRTQPKASGLGLTIVHGIMLFQGGQVELSSAEDKGTTVTLWFPAMRLEPFDKENPLGSKAPPVRKKALLIADDPLIKEVLRGWLTTYDLEIETPTNEKEARRSIQRAGDRCALIICETDLNGGRGEDLYNALADLNCPARWVFLFSKRAPEVAPAQGREDPLLMKKPFSHTAFSEVIRKYTNR